MHYLAEHAATKRRSLKARFAGIGVAGAATIAGGVVTATEAKAAGGTIWDAVAQCETGQNWATTSVPGYSGGLGFANQYWAAFGGTQVLVASVPGHPRRADHRRSADPRGERSERLAGLWSARRPDQGQRWRRERRTGRRPSTSRSTTRTAPKATTTTTKKATTTPTATKPADSAPAVSGKNVTVKAGDTLSELAQALGVKGGWQALYQANTSIVKNSNLIYVGQVLSLPA